MYVGLLVASALSIWGFGYSEPALGGNGANFTVSAVASALVAIVGALGFCPLASRVGNAAFPTIVVFGLVSAALVFAWPLISNPILGDVANLIGLGLYCVILGLVSALVLSRWRSRHAT